MWQGEERGFLFKVLAGFCFLIWCQIQQRYLPNALAAGLVQGLYSFAPLSVCHAALILLESVEFLWCWACVKIWLLLTAGHISRVWKSGRAQFMPLAGQGVSESCNFLSVGDWGRTCLLSRETAWFIHCPVHHSTFWKWGVIWAGPCCSYHLLMTSLVSCSSFLWMWSHVQCCYISAKGRGISIRILWGTGAWRSLAQD